MTSNEPINLREWRPPASAQFAGRLFTCGRPGRGTVGYGRARKPVDDGTIDRWVAGLPKAEVLHIVSLLGRKKNGVSEFDYYPFRSSHEHGTKPTLQEWLDRRYGQRFVVCEFPTVDARGIEDSVLDDVKRRVLSLLDKSFTVVIVDSAGAERTARVSEDLGFGRYRRTCVEAAVHVSALGPATRAGMARQA